jgi:hypothetical protein
MENGKKKAQREKKNEVDQVGDYFIPSEIPKRIFLDGALVGVGSLKPQLT